MDMKYPEKLILVLFSFLCTFDVEDIKQKPTLEKLLNCIWYGAHC